MYLSLRCQVSLDFRHRESDRKHNRQLSGAFVKQTVVWKKQRESRYQQRPATDKCGILPVLINQVILAQIHIYSFTYCLWVLFHASVKFTGCSRYSVVHKDESWHWLALYRKFTNLFTQEIYVLILSFPLIFCVILGKCINFSDSLFPVSGRNTVGCATHMDKQRKIPVRALEWAACLMGVWSTAESALFILTFPYLVFQASSLPFQPDIQLSKSIFLLQHSENWLQSGPSFVPASSPSLSLLKSSLFIFS